MDLRLKNDFVKKVYKSTQKSSNLAQQLKSSRIVVSQGEDSFRYSFLSGKEAKLTRFYCAIQDLQLKKFKAGLDKITQQFYEQEKTLEEIRTFETNKAIVSKLFHVLKDPKEATLYNRNYWFIYDKNRLIEDSRRCFVDILKKDITKDNLSELKSVKKLTHDGTLPSESPIEYVCRKYFSQYSSINLDELKAQIVDIPFKIADKETRRDCVESIQDFKGQLIPLFKESIETTYDSDIMKKYSTGREFYELPFKFAISAFNEYQRKGNAYISDKIPQIFEGIKEEELFEALDVLSAQLRIRKIDSTICKMPIGQKMDFTIGSKEFNATCIGSGLEGIAYKITSKNSSNSVIMKVFASPNIIGSSDCIGSIAIQREATKAGCTDISRLLMGNPLAKPCQIRGNNNYKGAWSISEDAKEIKRKNTKPILEWLDEHNLAHHDLKKNYTDGAFTNGYLTDFGYIGTKLNKRCLDANTNTDINEVVKAYFVGKTTRDIYFELNQL